MVSSLNRPIALLVAFGFVAAAACLPAQAEDKEYPVSLSTTMASPTVKEHIDGTVAFYFGDAVHPAVLQSFGSYVTNQKTNNFLKSDLTSCTWVFTSALVELEKKAHKLGANAVVNIHSFYKKEDVPITSDIPCHVGAAISGIALKGDFVKVAQ
jgi:hypothetical protein